MVCKGVERGEKVKDVEIEGEMRGLEFMVRDGV